MRERVICVFILFNINTLTVCSQRKITEDDIKLYREKVVSMFHHAYDGYIKYAYPYDELRPLTCDGHDTWGSYSLTLIDALDTLAIMGNYTEFRRVAELVIDKMNFDLDINASVFETNIRILGGLLSAHLFTKRAGMEVEPGWPCTGPLLQLAEDVARRLLPAFDTPTGMPYGTVNLRHGVPKGETTVTCTAGVGTFLIEFGTLSRLIGDPVFEKVAVRALRALWNAKSSLDLVGNHIDVATGKWTALDSGIGGGIDSYFEYLVKGAIMFDIPELLEHFRVYEKAIVKHVKREDWYMWAHMSKGGITLPMFTSLDAYWPGIQSLLGDVDSAMKTIHNFHQVWRQFGFLPEYYNIPKSEAHTGREGYPLRPELIESAVYLYQATKDPFLLEIGIDMLEAIEHSTKTKCGYATVKNVNTHQLDNRMESFFLAETTKYLYLLFDPDNFIHNNGSRGTVIQTPNGECVIDAGGYFFTSEAHPIDAASVYCCSTQKKQDDAVLLKMHDNLNLLSLFNIEDEETRFRGQKLKSFTQDLHGDKLGDINYELPSDGLSSENGFQNSVIEILSNYLKTSDNADNTLLKLGASLELLKSQISKLESTKSKDTENFMSDVEVEVDLRKTTNGENVEGSVGSKDSMKSEPVSDTEQQKGDRQFKPEPPIPTSNVVPDKAEAPPSGPKEEIVKGLGNGTDLSTDGDSLEKDKTVEHHESITNDSRRIQSESENRNMQQAEAPKTVVLSVKTDSTGQASVQTGDKVQSNINVGCRAQEDGKSCPYLHICKFYVIGQCRFGKRCKRGHDVFDPQVKEILNKYGINTNRTPKEILQEIRNVEIDIGDDASSQASAHSKDPYRTGLDSDNDDPSESEEASASASPDDPPADICIFHLRGRCAFGKSCRKSHKGMTYQWQYRKKALNQWDDFQHNHNVEVEFNYCDVARSECYVKTDTGVLKLNFDTLEGVLLENNQVVVQMSLRRLSTPSSEVEKFQPLATVWKWYWNCEDGKWQEYGQGNQSGRYQSTVDSSSMEQNYLKNPTGQLQFNTLGYEYVMDFEQMLQQNLQSGTQRNVRRRPVFVNEKEMERNKKKAPEAGSQTGKVVSRVTGPALTRPMQNYIPPEWEIHMKRMGGQQHVIEHFQRTVITGDSDPRLAEEVKKIKELFYQTMAPNQYITCIERIENGELWMNFVSKREKMSMKKKSGDINEKKLFHGTSHKYIDAICRQGFDFRFSGQSTGTKYGKGSYFTKSAKFADSYTDRSRDKEMFLVRVLAGDYTLGQSTMVRPPHKTPTNLFDLYDSCVDDMGNPNIFVIFTFDQVYPEYVIKYRS